MGTYYRLERVEDDDSFFKRHRRMLVIVGAMIILGTFVAKEVVRDSLKEHLDSISTAINIFDIRRDSVLSHSALDVRRKEATERMDRARKGSFQLSGADDSPLSIEYRQLRTVSSDIDRLNEAKRPYLLTFPKTRRSKTNVRNTK